MWLNLYGCQAVQRMGAFTNYVCIWGWLYLGALKNAFFTTGKVQTRVHTQSKHAKMCKRNL